MKPKRKSKITLNRETWEAKNEEIKRLGRENKNLSNYGGWMTAEYDKLSANWRLKAIGTLIMACLVLTLALAVFYVQSIPLDKASVIKAESQANNWCKHNGWDNGFVILYSTMNKLEICCWKDMTSKCFSWEEVFND